MSTEASQVFDFYQIVPSKQVVCGSQWQVVAQSNDVNLLKGKSGR